MKTFAAVTVILGAFQLANGQHCPPGTYRDHVTARCDPCSDICQFKEITNTVEDCLKYCPDYGKTTLTSSTTVPEITCRADKVYNITLSTCVSCKVICDQSKNKRSLSQCAKECPESQALASDHTITVAVIVLCVIIFIVATVGLAWIFCWKQRRLDCHQEPSPPPPTPAPPSPQPSPHLPPQPHPSVKYVPVPIHVQCEDNDSESYHGHQPTEEEAKFPSAFPDLPYTAQLSADTT